MKNNLPRKNNAYVQGSFELKVKDVSYKLIAIINHRGSLYSGHYYSLLEHNGKMV